MNVWFQNSYLPAKWISNFEFGTLNQRGHVSDQSGQCYETPISYTIDLVIWGLSFCKLSTKSIG